MQTVEYEISLRLWHPSITPFAITESIGIDPKFHHVAGQPKQTPNGEPLYGTHKENYWCADLVSWCKSDGSAIEKELGVLLVKLSPQQGLFQEIQNDGGRVALWVSTHSPNNYSIQLSSALMHQLSEIGLSVLIDVYPYPQNW